MSEFIVVAFAVFVVFAVLAMIYYFKKDPGRKSEVYQCSLCGERDCICHPEGGSHP